MSTHRERSGPADSLADRIDDVLAARYREALTLATIARSVGRNASYVSAMYRRARGMTITARLTHLRVDHARSMLAWSGMSVLEVATASGFGSLSQFYEAFSRLNGGPPRRPGGSRSAQKPAAALAETGAHRGAARAPMILAAWVDDAPENNIRERRELLARGVAVDSFATGEQGLAALEYGGYSLLVSDIRRPDTERSRITDSGWTLAETVRQRWPDLPIVFYCGYADPARRKRAREIGALGVHTHPADLINAVMRALAPRGRANIKTR